VVMVDNPIGAAKFVEKTRDFLSRHDYTNVSGVGRHHALARGIDACWDQPLRGSNGVLYLRHRRSIVDRLALASIARLQLAGRVTFRQTPVRRLSGTGPQIEYGSSSTFWRTPATRLGALEPR